MTYQRGDFVLAGADGTGRLAQGYGSVGFRTGEELVITSGANRSILNVRRSSGGRVFHIPAAKVRPVSRKVGEVPPGSIEADDPRIAWLFEDAGRLADRLGLCKDYDRIADALGFPGRIRTFNIKFEAAEGIEITAKVEARSKKQAERIIAQRLSTSAPPIKQLTA